LRSEWVFPPRLRFCHLSPAGGGYKQSMETARVDTTRLAASLLDPIPANRAFGIEVLRAEGASAEVGMEVAPRTTNVIGSLHSSGLTALVDAAGLAAVIATARSEAEMAGVVPLGTVARLRFLAPARGRLVASCTIERDDLPALQALLEGETERAQLTTEATVADAAGAIVCLGSFSWKLRRSPPAL
jgi:acyl-coenzyme A thioesterase PaaI-like protein